MPRKNRRKANKKHHQSTIGRNANDQRLHELQQKEQIYQQCIEALVKAATSQARVRMYVAGGSVAISSRGYTRVYGISNKPLEILGTR